MLKNENEFLGIKTGTIGDLKDYTKSKLAIKICKKCKI